MSWHQAFQVSLIGASEFHPELDRQGTTKPCGKEYCVLRDSRAIRYTRRKRLLQAIRENASDAGFRRESAGTKRDQEWARFAPAKTGKLRCQSTRRLLRRRRPMRMSVWPTQCNR